GATQALDAAEVSRQVLRRRLADVADAEPVEEARERRLLARLDAGDEIGRALLRHALERLDGFLRQRVDVGQRFDETGIDELVDDLLAEPLDVERAAAREVEDRELALRGAEEAAFAAMVDPALLARHLAAADRAGERHAEVRNVGLALARHAADDLGDHVAGAAHDHRVADANALAAHLEQVVQGGVGDGGAADLDVDVVEACRLLLSRVLLRHRPARLARLEAQPLLQLARVDLVDDAV